MRGLTAAEPQFPDDNGAADPAVHAVLAAYAAGRCGEYSALTVLARSRLLVPVVAVLTEAAGEGANPVDAGRAPAGAAGAGDRAAAADLAGVTGELDPGAGPGQGPGLRREKSAEMALPTLIGRDGRPAVIAFTSLDALTRWRPDARPVTVPAASVWQAATQEASAVVIDVAGPVPVAVEGARLAALAAGSPVPLPHQDPDVLGALHAALAQEPLIVQAALTTPDQRVDGLGAPGAAGRPGQDGLGLGALGLDGLGLDGPGLDGPGLDGPGLDGPGLDGPGLDGSLPGRADLDEAGPDQAGPEAADPYGDRIPGTGQPVADLALRVTLAEGSDPAQAAAAVQRTADALLAATAGRLRRGLEVSVIQPGRAE
jgi:SseB protein N-terminal domain